MPYFQTERQTKPTYTKQQLSLSCHCYQHSDHTTINKPQHITPTFRQPSISPCVFYTTVRNTCGAPQPAPLPLHRSSFCSRYNLLPQMLSSEDEHDELVNDINSKAKQQPTTTRSSNKSSTSPHITTTTTSHSPYPKAPFHPTSPFPLSTSLPLPPPPPAPSAAESEAADELYLYVHKLDRKALTLLCSSSSTAAAAGVSTFGVLQLATQALFHSLDCKRELYGVDSVACLSHAELLIQLLNRTAMTCVQQLQSAYGSEQGAAVDEKETRRDVKRLRSAFRELPLAWLKEAEQLCVAYPELLSAHVLTLNHLACCYRLINKPRTATRLLQEAIRRAAETPEQQQQQREEGAEETKEQLEGDKVTTDSDERLHMRAVLSANMCAVLCQMECWEQAGLHAKLAVDLCQQHILALTLAISADADSPLAPLSELSAALSLLSHCYSAAGTVELELHVPSCLHWFEKAQAVEGEHTSER